jgi:hypothetical protein
MIPLSIMGTVVVVGALLFFILDNVNRSSNYQRAIKSYRFDYKEFLKKKEMFFSQLSIYKEELRRINIEISVQNAILNQNPIALDHFRKKLLLITITKTEKGQYPDFRRDYKKGKSEIFFYSKLYEWFGEKIYMDVGISSKNLKTIFVPDFLYYDLETNLHIAIEIDEPYSLLDKKPIHYFFQEDEAYYSMQGDIFYNKDYGSFGKKPYSFSRMNEIKDAGWIIIRFDEKQIIETSDECCYFIYDFITKNLKLDSPNVQISTTNILQKSKSWTHDEAINMQKNRIREYYLSKIPVLQKAPVIRNFSDYSTSYKKFIERSNTLSIKNMDEL